VSAPTAPLSRNPGAIGFATEGAAGVRGLARESGAVGAALQKGISRAGEGTWGRGEDAYASPPPPSQHIRMGISPSAPGNSVIHRAKLA
jgi:hypothetical protein